MERRKKRYCVMSMTKGRTHVVDGFDLKEQAEMFVMRIQNAFQFVPREKRIDFPNLVILDTRESGHDGMRTTRDRLEQMSQIDAENERRTQAWVKRHEASPRS